MSMIATELPARRQRAFRGEQRRMALPHLLLDEPANDLVSIRYQVPGSEEINLKKLLLYKWKEYLA